MRLLIVAATEAEIAPLVNHNPHGVDILITGVGMAATAASLARHLALHPCDLAINLGIAGSFTRTLALGSVVEVTEDIFSELGAEDGESFLPLPTLGFGENTFHPTEQLKTFGLSLPNARAITVNTVHGAEASINTIIERLNPTIESMEGAAFFLACREASVPCIQVRAISNYVERRDRENWEIPLAIQSLNQFATTLIKRVSVS